MLCEERVETMPKLTIARSILSANENIANEVHAMLTARNVRTINIMSSPGAGKTTLLEKTIAFLRGRLTMAVIEGDIETCEDAQRIEVAGAQCVQINTRGACHLEAHMVQDALMELEMAGVELLAIENIGNLVCPASWRLGEDRRVIVLSVAEGDDKPAKYPQMFAEADVLLLNKIDLLPYVDYDLEKVKQQVHAIHPDLPIIEISCRTGEGLGMWCEWLLALCRGSAGLERAEEECQPSSSR
jgi:hydrogenase nickel incorporation protein HypB